MPFTLRRLLEEFNENRFCENTEFSFLLLEETLAESTPNLLGASNNYDAHIRTPNHQQCNYGAYKAKWMCPHIYTFVMTCKEREQRLTPGCVVYAVAVENKLVVNFVRVCLFSWPNIRPASKLRRYFLSRERSISCQTLASVDNLFDVEFWKLHYLIEIQQK